MAAPRPCQKQQFKSSFTPLSIQTSDWWSQLLPLISIIKTINSSLARRVQKEVKVRRSIALQGLTLLLWLLCCFCVLGLWINEVILLTTLTTELATCLASWLVVARCCSSYFERVGDSSTSLPGRWLGTGITHHTSGWTLPLVMSKINWMLKGQSALNLVVK